MFPLSESSKKFLPTISFFHIRLYNQTRCSQPLTQKYKQSQNTGYTREHASPTMGVDLDYQLQHYPTICLTIGLNSLITHI